MNKPYGNRLTQPYFTFRTLRSAESRRQIYNKLESFSRGGGKTIAKNIYTYYANDRNIVDYGVYLLFMSE
jgi:hypothetical protein